LWLESIQSFDDSPQSGMSPDYALGGKMLSESRLYPSMLNIYCRILFLLAAFKNFLFMEQAKMFALKFICKIQ
jgi:hypothetical protein